MRLLIVLAVTGLSAAHMEARPGWHVGAGRAHACPGVSANRCTQVSSWAATVRWRDCADCLPHRTIGALPANGIAIQISVGLEASPPRWMQSAAWPPRIRLRDVVAGFEGLPGRIGVYQHYVRVGRYDVGVFAFFGRDRPTAAQLRAANAELATARLPAGPGRA